MDITDRETEVLALISEGLSNKEISKRLGISENTVKFHLNNLYRKLEVSNRTQASAMLLRYNPFAGDQNCN